MNIRQTFLSLTTQTYPAGTEHQVINLFPTLPYPINQDNHGNYFVQIGDSSCMFTSHLDTASTFQGPVSHRFIGNLVCTDEQSILGADCKAGVTIMLNMILNNVKGLYYFFIAEEIGCIGSFELAEAHLNNPVAHLQNISKVISFDRRCTRSVITHQSGQRGCSDRFTNALIGELNSKGPFNYIPDPTGICTDSRSFIGIFPECTNLSVGYYKEHQKTEYQDMDHLEKLAETVLKVDWESL